LTETSSSEVSDLEIKVLEQSVKIDWRSAVI